MFRIRWGDRALCGGGRDPGPRERRSVDGWFLTDIRSIGNPSPRNRCPTNRPRDIHHLASIAISWNEPNRIRFCRLGDGSPRPINSTAPWQAHIPGHDGGVSAISSPRPRLPRANRLSSSVFASRDAIPDSDRCHPGNLVCFMMPVVFRVLPPIINAPIPNAGELRVV